MIDVNDLRWADRTVFNLEPLGRVVVAGPSFGAMMALEKLLTASKPMSDSDLVRVFLKEAAEVPAEPESMEGRDLTTKEAASITDVQLREICAVLLEQGQWQRSMPPDESGDGTAAEGDPITRMSNCLRAKVHRSFEVAKRAVVGLPSFYSDRTLGLFKEHAHLRSLHQDFEKMGSLTRAFDLAGLGLKPDPLAKLMNPIPGLGTITHDPMAQHRSALAKVAENNAKERRAVQAQREAIQYQTKLMENLVELTQSSQADIARKQAEDREASLKQFKIANRNLMVALGGLVAAILIPALGFLQDRQANREASSSQAELMALIKEQNRYLKVLSEARVPTPVVSPLPLGLPQHQDAHSASFPKPGSAAKGVSKGLH